MPLVLAVAPMLKLESRFWTFVENSAFHQIFSWEGYISLNQNRFFRKKIVADWRLSRFMKHRHGVDTGQAITCHENGRDMAFTQILDISMGSNTVT